MLRLLILFSVLLSAVEIYAEDTSVYVLVLKKQEEKKSTRWSLSDWMAQKERVRLMDHWLAMNTTELGAEFRLGYGHNTYENELAESKSSNALDFQFFYRFIGLEYSLEKSQNDLVLQQSNVKLNLLGSSQQSTHINFIYGITESDLISSGAKSTGIGFDGDIYLFSSLGYHFSYVEFQEDSSAATSFSGLKRENQIFIESGFMRIFYSIYSSRFNSTSTNKKLDGSSLGLEFHF